MLKLDAPKRFVSFYAECLRFAASGAWGYSAMISAGAGGGLTLLHAALPSWSWLTTLAGLPWHQRAVVFGGLLGIRLIYAPFRLYDALNPGQALTYEFHPGKSPYQDQAFRRVDGRQLHSTVFRIGIRNRSGTAVKALARLHACAPAVNIPLGRDLRILGGQPEPASRWFLVPPSSNPSVFVEVVRSEWDPRDGLDGGRHWYICSVEAGMSIHQYEYYKATVLVITEAGAELHVPVYFGSRYRDMLEFGTEELPRVAAAVQQHKRVQAQVAEEDKARALQRGEREEEEREDPPE